MSTQWDVLSPESAALIRSWPPMALVSAPRLAEVMGVTTQRLRKWRARSKGPVPEPRDGVRESSNPTPTYYVVAKLWCFLDGRPADDWCEITKEWILDRFLGAQCGDLLVAEPLTREDIERISLTVRGLLRFVEFRQSARVVNMPGPQPVRRPQFSLTRPTVAVFSREMAALPPIPDVP